MGAGGGPMAAETVYALQALHDGLPLCRALEPHYAGYPPLWALAVAGVAIEIGIARAREAAKAAGVHRGA